MGHTQERRKMQMWPVLRSYAQALRPYKGLVALLFLTGLIAELATLIAPLFLKQLIDLLAAGPESIAARVLFGLLGFFALALFIRWVSTNAQGVVSSYLDSRVMTNLENHAFAYLLGHSHNFFISNFAGSLTRRVSRYARSFEQIFDAIIFNFFSTLIFAVGAIAVLFNRSVVLGFALLIWTILFLLLQVALIRRYQPIRIARAEEDTRVTGVLSDAISNQTTVMQFSARPYEEQLFNTATEKWRKATLRSWLTDTWVNGALGLLIIFVQIGLLGGVLYFWLQGVVTVGDFLLVQVYAISLVDRLWGIGRIVRHIYDAFADAFEMVELLEKPHEVQNVPNAIPLEVSKGSIVFNQVNFGFTDQGVLNDFSLTVAPGEKVALVGHSGAGKSTITKLLLRFYDVSSGRIEIDGQDISHVTQESLRASIAFVPQEPILFHRSLMDNIRYGRLGATDEEVIEAAKKARCHEFISAFPLGYETHVGERGVKLSGGERQRVAIARAILKNAPILILDEATSSLDSESEALIQEALDILMEGKTVVVIAHRLSTIMHMDRIVVIEEGKIAAEGTHTELLDKKGSLYHKLWSIQAGSFIADSA